MGRHVSDTVEDLAWKYVAYCTRRFDRVIVTSPDIRDRLASRGFAGLECVPLGVDAARFRPQASVRDTTTTTLLYVGRLSPEKDLGVLLAAMRDLPAEFRLEFVGEGPLRRRLEQAARADGRLRVLGPCVYGDALASRYAAADIFVNPSPNETFGLAALEAAASGLPVVAAACGGTRDTVAPEIGVVAKPGDSADFAAKIRSVAAAPGRFAGGRAFVEREYSWGRCFDRLLDLYGSVKSVG
jgi:alpha-1,6-mannosyltransferase